jgi:hypothetical protein
LLIPTFFYFFQLFKLSPTLNLFDQPTFWINIGILFAFSCTLPLTILEYFNQKFVYSNFYFYYINFISYSALYVAIIRAYCCQRKGITQIETDPCIKSIRWNLENPIIWHKKVSMVLNLNCLRMVSGPSDVL